MQGKRNANDIKAIYQPTLKHGEYYGFSGMPDVITRPLKMGEEARREKARLENIRDFQA